MDKGVVVGIVFIPLAYPAENGYVKHEDDTDIEIEAELLIEITFEVK